MPDTFGVFNKAERNHESPGLAGPGPRPRSNEAADRDAAITKGTFRGREGGEGLCGGSRDSAAELFEGLPAGEPGGEQGLDFLEALAVIA